MLDKGFYAQEIVQKGMVSKGFLSRIITYFKSRNLIEQIQSYPKRYKLTILGTLFLEQGDLNQRRISEFTSDKELLPKSLPPVRAHLDRFSNELHQKPSWLSTVRNMEQIKGLIVKRVRLNNWDKILIYFNYDDFNGLESIEVCNKVIIYNFKQKLGSQLVNSNEELKNRDEDLVFNCKKARSFLQEKGFLIGQEEPVRCQKPHYAISSKDPHHIGQLGKKLLMTIKTPNESLIIDDSPKTGDGEEETDDIEKVKSYLDIPNKLENIETEISEMRDNLTQITNKKELGELKSEITEMKKAFSDMAIEMKNFCHTIVDLVKKPEKDISIETDSGGSMYR